MKIKNDEIVGAVDELAELMGVSVRRVQQLETAGTVTAIKHGLYNISASIKSYCEFIRDGARGTSTTREEKSERIRLTKVKADIAELNHGEMLGELVRRKKIDDQDFKLARTLRNNLESIADRCAPLVAADPDSDSVHRIISTEVARALNQIIDAMQKTEVDTAALDVARRAALEAIEAEENDEG